ncbi:lipase class 2 [Purpureocillium lavendulum]|uniref:Lipase class 2 n=1 Tax=Purpureocillium lavendulum TaxID=1247861 RepID=A0AB34G644_9HYPO|nr:lipase class 2 [Purpureocillium lavendulum]
MVCLPSLALGLASLATVLASPLPDKAPTKEDDSVAIQRTNDFSCKSSKHPNPVVLLHGLGASEQIDLNFLEVWLRHRGFCTFALTYGSYAPYIPILGGLKPIAESSREIAAFIREVRSRTGAAKVDVVGHSEGGFQSLYTAKFGGAGVTDAIDKVVAIAPPTHGTSFAGLYNLAYLFGSASREAVGKVLDAVGCAACDDLGPDGAAVRRLNDGTPIAQRGHAVTVITSRLDELVTPTTTAFVVEPGVSNIYVQDYCPLDPVGHIGEAVDTNVWNLVLNGLDGKTGRKFVCLAGPPGR